MCVLSTTRKMALTPFKYFRHSSIFLAQCISFCLSIAHDTPHTHTSASTFHRDPQWSQDYALVTSSLQQVRQRTCSRTRVRRCRRRMERWRWWRAGWSSAHCAGCTCGSTVEEQHAPSTLAVLEEACFESVLYRTRWSVRRGWCFVLSVLGLCCCRAAVKEEHDYTTAW